MPLRVILGELDSLDHDSQLPRTLQCSTGIFCELEKNSFDLSRIGRDSSMGLIRSREKGVFLPERLTEPGCQRIHQVSQDEILGYDQLLAAEREQLLADAGCPARCVQHVPHVGHLRMLRTQRLED